VAARRLSGINGKQVVRALQRGGFEVLRISGSHHVPRRPGEPASKVIVPVHGTQDLPPGTLRTIITQSGLTTEEFIALL
jgi:predicted RNA binding protein YcfA (HicA-like mRNA interferase family)